MRSALFAMLLALGTSSAMAAMAPQHYEQARIDATDIIVIAISHIVAPADGKNWGDCRVEGSVLIIERGARYKPGDTLALDVACATRDADYPDGGALYEELPGFLGSSHGRAFLGPDGKLALWQYDQLTAAELP